MTSEKGSLHPALRWLRESAPLLAGVLGVAVIGLVVVRAIRSDASPAAPPGESSSAAVSAAASASAAPLRFDLLDDGTSHAGVPLRPMDREIFSALMDFSFERERMLDVFPDKPYRVRFVGSFTQKRISFILIDLQRNGTIDERWELKHGEPIRNVAKDPAANGQPVKYTLRRGRWQLH